LDLSPEAFRLARLVHRCVFSGYAPNRPAPALALPLFACVRARKRAPDLHFRRCCA